MSPGHVEYLFTAFNGWSPEAGLDIQDLQEEIKAVLKNPAALPTLLELLKSSQDEVDNRLTPQGVRHTSAILLRQKLSKQEIFANLPPEAIPEIQSSCLQVLSTDPVRTVRRAAWYPNSDLTGQLLGCSGGKFQLSLTRRLARVDLNGPNWRNNRQSRLS